MIELNTIQKQIWEQNYKGPNDKTVQDTFRRVAHTIAQVEAQDIRQSIEQQFYNLMSNFQFLPGGRILANAGVDERKKTTLYNCYVYHPYDFGIRDIDSMSGIFESLKQSAKILASEGGLGINLGFIRPNGAFIHGTGVRTPGAVKFMQLWDKVSEIITQGTYKKIEDKYSKIAKRKIRKGAMISVLSIANSQIKQFITSKQIADKLTRFNLSVLVSDRFMSAVQKNQMWQLVFPDLQYSKYAEQWDGDLDNWIRRGKPVVVYEEIPARDLWDLLMISVYNHNEPGILFYDTINNNNPISYCERIITTNPCSEIPQPSGVCDLGYLNLVKFYDEQTQQFNWDRFQYAIKLGVIFLDNVCDISYVPIPEYYEKVLQKRRIGLGVMGLGSLLMMLGLRFGSNQAIQFTDKLFKFKAEHQLYTSAALGAIKGSFKLFDKQKYFTSKYWYELPISYKVKREIEDIGCMRNSVRSANAPTGTIAIFAGQVSNGIEPVYMKQYIRWMIVTQDEIQQLLQKHEDLIIPNPFNGEWFETDVFKFKHKGNQQVLQGTIDNQLYQIDKSRGLIKAILVQDYGWKYVKQHNLSQKGVVETKDLTVSDHINMLATSAKYVDQNQSKTINIPEDYPYEDFKKVYMQAYKKGIKGVTTYRAGTMASVLEEKKEENNLEQLYKQDQNVILSDVKLPDKTYALQYKIKDKNKKKWYITLSFIDKELTIPVAIFIRTNSKQSTQITDKIIQSLQKLLLNSGIRKQLVQEQKLKCENQSNVDKIGRFIGMALRHNIPINKIVDILQINSDGLSTLSFHIRKILSQYIKNGTRVEGKKCPQCDSDNLVYQDGCVTCLNCGYGKCQ